MQPIKLTPGVYFVSGIDTDCGKSYATGMLARAIALSGQSVITQKFIQTGSDTYSGVISEDILLHRRLMQIDPTAEDTAGITCPLIFRHPASPHLAAALESSHIDYEAIRGSSAELAANYEVVLCEGAGGLMVPLEPITDTETDFLTIDYVAAEGLPLLFVTSAKLGSLNHTILSLEACRSRGVKLEAVLWNSYPEGDSLISADTRATIERYIAKYHPGSRLVEIPNMAAQ